MENVNLSEVEPYLRCYACPQEARINPPRAIEAQVKVLGDVLQTMELHYVFIKTALLSPRVSSGDFKICISRYKADANDMNLLALLVKNFFKDPDKYWEMKQFLFSLPMIDDEALASLRTYVSTPEKGLPGNDDFCPSGFKGRWCIREARKQIKFRTILGKTEHMVAQELLKEYEEMLPYYVDNKLLLEKREKYEKKLKIIESSS